MKTIFIILTILICTSVYGQEVDTLIWEPSGVRCLTIHGDEGCPGLIDYRQVVQDTIKMRIADSTAYRIPGTNTWIYNKSNPRKQIFWNIETNKFELRESMDAVYLVTQHGDTLMLVKRVK